MGHRLTFENGKETGYAHGVRDAVREIYADCHHTKYIGCLPCVHDQIAARVEALQPWDDLLEYHPPGSRGGQG